MASFVTIIDALCGVLAGDTNLSAFCIARWKKDITVKKVFKKRVELNATELPVILVTRPSVEKTYQLRSRDGENTVRLYCGFEQADKETALDNIITFEETIDDALFAGQKTIVAGGGVAINATPIASINDEGEFHPIYFMAMDLKIKHRR